MGLREVVTALCLWVMCSWPIFGQDLVPLPSEPVPSEPAPSAQATNAVGISADEITYSRSTGIFEARGNVTITTQGRTLRAEIIRYDLNSEEISAPNGVIIQTEDGISLSANSAELSQNAARMIIRGASLLIDETLQLQAAELTQSDDRYRVLSRVVGSTCEICRPGEEPFWQIRSSRVVQDRLEQRIYFEDPQLFLLGLPVFYLPALSTPDPSVRRASGFLVPTFQQSSALGIGFKAPYYVVLGDHADLTVTPFVTTRGNLILGAEYRQNFKNGSLFVEGAVALADQLSDKSLRSFINAQAKFNLARDYKLSFGVHLASDRDFKNQYDFGDEDRLLSFIALEKTKASRYTYLGASFTQSLRPNEIDQDIPVILPEFYRRDIFKDPLFEGKIGYTIASTTLARENSQFSRLSVGFDWHREWITSQGLVFGGFATATANGYYLRDYLDNQTGVYYSDAFLLDGDTNLGIELRYPHKLRRNQVTHVLEPVAQLVWAPTRQGDGPNEDSVQAEFEESNLFSLNRFPGFDEAEAGLRANIGLNYTRLDPNGWEVSATIGQVFRLENLDQFPASVSAGLTGRRSDFVASASLRYRDQFDFTTRALFDEDFKVSKNETYLNFQRKDLRGYLSYVWLDQNTILNVNQAQHEGRIGLFYQYNQNWLYSAEWRHNLDNGRAVEGNLGARFENECATVTFSLSLEYDERGNVTRELGLQLSLEGLGARKRTGKFARRCAI